MKLSVGAVRMSLINDNWVVQATNSELEDSVFDMVVAGSLNPKGEIDIVMVEAGQQTMPLPKLMKAVLHPAVILNIQLIRCNI